MSVRENSVLTLSKGSNAVRCKSYSLQRYFPLNSAKIARRMAIHNIRHIYVPDNMCVCVSVLLCADTRHNTTIQSHSPDTGPTSPGFILLIMSVKQGNHQYHFNALGMARSGL